MRLAFLFWGLGFQALIGFTVWIFWRFYVEGRLEGAKQWVSGFRAAGGNPLELAVPESCDSIGIRIKMAPSRLAGMFRIVRMFLVGVGAAVAVLKIGWYGLLPAGSLFLFSYGLFQVEKPLTEDFARLIKTSIPPRN